MRDFLFSLVFPHPNNNHKAKLLSHRFLLLIISFLLLSPLFFPHINPAFNSSVLAEISNQELLDLINQERVDNGLPVLQINSQLNLAASKKAEHMFKNDYWAHNSPDGITPWSFIKESGYDYVYAGENLARGFNNSNDAVNAWMASADHKANILSPNYNDVGYAVMSGELNGEETILIVQEFGSKNSIPASLPEKIVKNEILGFNISPTISLQPSLTLTIALFITGVFLALLILDLLFIKRRPIIRFTGHHLDHGLFLILIFVVLGIFSMGSVI